LLVSAFFRLAASYPACFAAVSTACGITAGASIIKYHSHLKTSRRLAFSRRVSVHLRLRRRSSLHHSWYVLAALFKQR
jgi:hypothetical protein